MKLSLASLSTGLATCVALFVVGCGASPDRESVAESEHALRTSYGDLTETLDAGDVARWREVRRSLHAGFARACGDKLCRGTLANLAAVRLACSSTRIARKMKDCVWVLGANVDHVDAATGSVTSDVRVWTCHVPVAGTASAMLAAFERAPAAAFGTPLPGTGRSFADALAACVAPRLSEPTLVASTGPFDELGVELWRGGDGPGAEWAHVKRRLETRFAETCGDSFCAGDYPDIKALGLSCAVDTTNERVASCSWSFAAADTAVDDRGHITAGTKTSRCAVAIDAQAVALTTALAVDDPLFTPLPGRDTSIYDALVGCL